MKYRRRTLEVEAVQWTGCNLEEIRAICPIASTAASGWTLTIPCSKERRILWVRSGYYVVRVKDDLYLSMEEEKFQAIFEALSEVDQQPTIQPPPQDPSPMPEQRYDDGSGGLICTHCGLD